MKNNMLMVALVVLGTLMVVAGTGAPCISKAVKRDNNRILKRIIEICPPLPDNATFSIPGYKSVQCFYKVESNGSKTLVEDLNSRVSIPKPIEMR